MVYGRGIELNVPYTRNTYLSLFRCGRTRRKRKRERKPEAREARKWMMTEMNSCSPDRRHQWFPIPLHHNDKLYEAKPPPRMIPHMIFHLHPVKPGFFSRLLFATSIKSPSELAGAFHLACWLCACKEHLYTKCLAAPLPSNHLFEES